MSPRSLATWWRKNAINILNVVLAGVGFLGVQAVSLIYFTGSLESRVTAIEQRGSPQVEGLRSRIVALELQIADQQRRLALIDRVFARIGGIETRLTRVEERQSNVLEILKANAVRLDAINDGLQQHVRQWPAAKK